MVVKRDGKTNRERERKDNGRERVVLDLSSLAWATCVKCYWGE